LFRSKKTFDPAGVEYPPIEAVQLVLQKRACFIRFANGGFGSPRFSLARLVAPRLNVLGSLHSPGVEQTASRNTVKLIAERLPAI
jgi:hypothetical protein